MEPRLSAYCQRCSWYECNRLDSWKQDQLHCSQRCLQSCIPVAISWTQLIAFYLHNLIRWKGRNKFPCLSVIIIISVSFSQTPVHTAWQGGLRVHSPAFTSEDFEPSAGWLGRSRWLVMTLVQRQLPTHPFTVPCGLRGGKNKACSVSWSKVVNGIPNHGVVFVI